MKRLILLTATILIYTMGFSQENFKWDKTDTITKTKAQLYTATKLFIAQEWKSAKAVIQNDDKDGGIILIKGISEKKETIMGIREYRYIYDYTVTFKFKDNKYKISIDNVYCESAVFLGSHEDIIKIEPFEGDNYPRMGDMTKKKATEMMLSLKQELQSIFDDYTKFLQTENSSKGDW